MQTRTLPEAQPHGPGSGSVHCSALRELSLRRGAFPQPEVWRGQCLDSPVSGALSRALLYCRLYPAAWQAMTPSFPEPGAVWLRFGFYKFQRLFFAASTFLCERKTAGSSSPLCLGDVGNLANVRRTDGQDPKAAKINIGRM